jgi:hypothetical protein
MPTYTTHGGTSSGTHSDHRTRLHPGTQARSYAADLLLRQQLALISTAWAITPAYSPKSQTTENTIYGQSGLVLTGIQESKQLFTIIHNTAYHTGETGGHIF